MALSDTGTSWLWAQEGEDRDRGVGTDSPGDSPELSPALCYLSPLTVDGISFVNPHRVHTPGPPRQGFGAFALCSLLPISVASNQIRHWPPAREGGRTRGSSECVGSLEPEQTEVAGALDLHGAGGQAAGLRLRPRAGASTLRAAGPRGVARSPQGVWHAAELMTQEEGGTRAAPSVPSASVSV